MPCAAAAPSVASAPCSTKAGSCPAARIWAGNTWAVPSGCTRSLPQSPRLVYFSLGKKAEIVLFGEGIQLSPLKALAGSEFTVAIEEGDDRCTISRITSQGSLTQKQCGLRLADVLRTMADLGAGYPEAVDLLRKLDDRQAINCPIAANTLPTLVSVEDLADGGRNPSFLTDHPARAKGAE